MSPTSSGSEAPASDQSERTDSVRPDGLSDVLRQLSELFEYGSHYVAAATDSAKLSARQAALRVLVEVGFMLAAAGLAVGALIFVFVGVAGGLGELTGRAWLGNLLAGLLLLAVIIATVRFRIEQVKRSSHRRTVQSYEQRKLRQQARFGHDAAERAAAGAKHGV